MDDDYARRGYGELGIGFGKRVGIAVVDFQLAFTDARFALGGSALTDRAVQNTAILLKAARAAKLPVVSCYTAYHGVADAPHWKIPPVLETLRHGSDAAKLDPRIYDPEYDVVLCKAGPSIFFHTPAAPIFVKQEVDTVIVTGCTTSGCVRASVIDAFSYGFRVIVPEDCVGDVEEGPHIANLRDVGRRYADVVDLQICLDHIAALPRPNT
ncbi:isochorismatase family protein [Acidisphaera sp. L21]|uniref:isochorismatase family protein n=1 Tax=Acidisphaera sp. L21 TaxID=1641851 RepID=UPI00131AF75E|nr:isochorismatase family protein [Acidisphaera sp. L21]